MRKWQIAHWMALKHVMDHGSCCDKNWKSLNPLNYPQLPRRWKVRNQRMYEILPQKGWFNNKWDDEAGWWPGGGSGDFDNIHHQASLHAGRRFRYNFSCATSQQVEGDSCTRDRVEQLLFKTLFKLQIMAGQSDVNCVIPGWSEAWPSDDMAWAGCHIITRATAWVELSSVQGPPPGHSCHCHQARWVGRIGTVEERCTPLHQDEISMHTHLQGKELIGAFGSLHPEGFECWWCCPWASRTEWSDPEDYNL